MSQGRCPWTLGFLNFDSTSLFCKRIRPRKTWSRRQTHKNVHQQSRCTYQQNPRFNPFSLNNKNQRIKKLHQGTLQSHWKTGRNVRAIESCLNAAVEQWEICKNHKLMIAPRINSLDGKRTFGPNPTCFCRKIMYIMNHVDGHCPVHSENNMDETLCIVRKQTFLAKMFKQHQLLQVSILDPFPRFKHHSIIFITEFQPNFL